MNRGALPGHQFAGHTVVAMLQVNPLTGVFQLQQPTLRYVRGVTLLVASLLQGVALPTLVQVRLVQTEWWICICSCKAPYVPLHTLADSSSCLPSVFQVVQLRLGLAWWHSPLVMHTCSSLGVNCLCLHMILALHQYIATLLTGPTISTSLTGHKYHLFLPLPVIAAFVLCSDTLQSFLFTAPYQIHILSRTPELPEEVQSKLLRQTSQLTVVQTCKAAMQLSFVPLIMMLCAFLYILTAFPSPRTVTENHPWGSEEPAALYPCCTGFIGWWASSVYIGWASLGVLMARLARTTDT